MAVTLSTLTEPCDSFRPDRMPHDQDVAAAALTLLESFAAGIVIIRGDGSIAWANREGESFAADLELEWMMRRLRRDSEQPQMVRRDDGLLMLTPIAIEGRGDDPAAPAFAVIIQRLHDDVVGTAAGTLERLFGLTPAEARVAIAICSGRTAAEIAEDQCVTYATVRSQLKSVFSKTGIHRQAELVRQIMAIRTISLAPAT